jgi:hypothetical protein
MLDAMAYPDEQGGALVDQHASEAELADRVIPVRIGWIQRHAEVLAALVAELEERWIADGRMADGALSASERGASERGASERGASERGASEPGAGERGAHER